MITNLFGKEIDLMKKTISIFVILVLLSGLSSWVCAKQNYPSATTEFFVNDFAGVLSRETRNNIQRLGESLEDLTTAQVVVVIVDTLDGQDIDTYAFELFEEWELGQKDKDNGVLILNAVSERLLRIEVGYGLEGALTDIETAEIRREYMNPYLKNSDYDSGILYGYSAVIDAVAQEYGMSLENIGGNAPQIPQNSEHYNRYAENDRSDNSGTNTFFYFIAFILFLVFDGIFFKFRITSVLLKIAFYSRIFSGGGGGRGGRGGRGGGWGGGGSSGGGWGGGGGSSGGGGRSGGGGSSGGY
jgi:uncharacterized protein